MNSMKLAGIEMLSMSGLCAAFALGFLSGRYKTAMVIIGAFIFTFALKMIIVHAVVSKYGDRKEYVDDEGYSVIEKRLSNSIIDAYSIERTKTTTKEESSNGRSI